LLGAGVEIHLPQVVALAVQQRQRGGAMVVVAVQVDVVRGDAVLDGAVDHHRHRGCRGLVDAGRDELVRGDGPVADLLVEGVPVGSLGAVREAHVQDRQARLAQEELLQILRAREHVAVRAHVAVLVPEGVPVHEEVLVRRRVAAAQQVPELRRAHGEVIQHQVQLELDAALGEGDEVGVGDQGLVQVVVDDREAAVEIAVEAGGQQV